jgi:hypothetical protein
MRRPNVSGQPSILLPKITEKSLHFWVVHFGILKVDMESNAILPVPPSDFCQALWLGEIDLSYWEQTRNLSKKVGGVTGAHPVYWY